jgi:hypothetical protein
MNFSKLIKWFNEHVLKWPRYHDTQINNLSWQKCQTIFSSYQVSTKSYNKFHTTFSHTSKVHVKGRRLCFLSTWRPTIDGQNSSQFVWAGLGVHFLLHCLVQEKRREEEAQLVLLVHKSKKTISLTKVCHSRPLDHLVHKSKTTIPLTNLWNSWPLGPLIHKIKPTNLDKLMSLTTIGSSYSQDQANYPWQTYVTHNQLGPIVCKSKTTIVDKTYMSR